MRYCKHGTCLCVEFRAQDIRVDANVCQCDHPLSEHNMTGTAHEGGTSETHELSYSDLIRLSPDALRRRGIILPPVG